MTFKTPQETAAAAVVSGTRKALMTWDRALVGGFLAGAYIAFGGLLAIAVSSGLDPKTWGTLPTLFTGAVFSVGLMLTVIAGAELLTGNMALLPIALLRRKITVAQLGVNWALVLVGNLLGSLFVAYFLAYKTGIIAAKGPAPGADAPFNAAAAEHVRAAAIAALKGVKETDQQIFLRAVGCNWLVCLAVWLALSAEDVGGKILGIFFPILAFVAIGFDHVVANMFFLPLGHYIGTPGLDWGRVSNNLWWAFLGNTVGAAVFVSFLYWFLYLRGERGEGQERAPAGAGAFATSGDGIAGGTPSDRTKVSPTTS